ncbi:hypothetical protein E2C01_043343 [Portunus trituberculatus]|uniref:Uncharacterized protein n=1 Tax=Portunus trituberculatus TaxID=210409 RepID=A0A5B7FXB0_PORTR|nr:hypothetical protein [Portunus trituberculatus]
MGLSVLRTSSIGELDIHDGRGFVRLSDVPLLCGGQRSKAQERSGGRCYWILSVLWEEPNQCGLRKLRTASTVGRTKPTWPANTPHCLYCRENQTSVACEYSALPLL